VPRETAAEFAQRTVQAVEADQFRDGGDPVPLDETAYIMGRLSDEALLRMQRFLDDLSRRTPLTTPTWAAHRTVLESLSSDIGRELVKREEP